MLLRPHASSLGYLSSAGVYEDKNAYPTGTDIPNIKIFRFEENIYYANVDMFKKLFIKRIGLRVDDQIKAMNDEIMDIEREYKTRLAKPHRQFPFFKRTVHEEEETIDEKKITEEKDEKVN